MEGEREGERGGGREKPSVREGRVWERAEKRECRRGWVGGGRGRKRER